MQCIIGCSYSSAWYQSSSLEYICVKKAIYLMIHPAHWNRKCKAVFYMCECLAGCDKRAPHLPPQWMLSTFQICRHHTHLVFPWEDLKCCLGAVMRTDKARTHMTADRISGGLPQLAPGVCCCCFSCWPFVLPAVWFSLLLHLWCLTPAW